MPSEIQITDNDLILVTGATGFLATHVVKQLLEKGYRVRGTVRSLRDEKKLAPLRNLVPNSRFKLELVEADLLKEETWINAVNGCTYVIHTASPLPLEDPKDENEVIKPAVNGTLNVLRACVQDGSRVKRVVLTSSGLAIAGDIHKDGYTYSEKDWPKTEGLAPYSKSKVLAEKAAWDFVRERERIRESCFELVVINPGFIMGPALQDSDNTSLVVVKRMMLGQLPVVPNVTITVCDVRDVATAHINALVIPEAKNNRHSIASLKGGSAFLDWAKILRDEFGSKGYKISTTKAPNFLIRIASCFEKDLTKITPMLGVKSSFDNSRMINVLGVQPRDIKTTVIDSAYSLIQRNLVPKKY